jgi:hypothetical protein
VKWPRRTMIFYVYVLTTTACILFTLQEIDIDLKDREDESLLCIIDCSHVFSRNAFFLKPLSTFHLLSFEYHSHCRCCQ